MAHDRNEAHCPFCNHLDDQALAVFLHELQRKKKRTTVLTIALAVALIIYALVILIVLPDYLN